MKVITIDKTYEYYLQIVHLDKVLDNDYTCIICTDICSHNSSCLNRYFVINGYFLVNFTISDDLIHVCDKCFEEGELDNITFIRFTDDVFKINKFTRICNE